ncbi:MAG: hypothetical protein V8S12_03855 [Lachnospiraceae bacterium]
MAWAEYFFCFEALPAFAKTAFCSNHRARSKLASAQTKEHALGLARLFLFLKAAVLLQMKKTPAMPYPSCSVLRLLPNRTFHQKGTSLVDFQFTN